jgi:4-hydroxy-3-methylbut-2-enyl diphosphate reductase
MGTLDVILANPRGFCAGVIRAIEAVDRALERRGPPVYVLHEIVHNRHVVEGLRTRGAVFVEDLEEVPPGAVTIFSAHGVATAAEDEAARRGLAVVDATCPLVSKVHRQAQRYARQGLEVLIIGHPGHREVEGTFGRIRGPVQVVASAGEVPGIRLADPARVAYVTQTTLSVDDAREVIDALRRCFPAIVGPKVDDICYATQSRQNAVRKLARRVDALLVVGSRTSSNTNRLREVAAQSVPAFLVEDETEVLEAWIEGCEAVGITAGASTPEVLVEGVIRRLGFRRPVRVQEMDGVREGTRFQLPETLGRLSGAERPWEPAR